MSDQEQARRLCRDLGGPEVDLWTLPTRALQRAESTGRSLREAALDVVSGWLATRAVEGKKGAKDQLTELWHAEVLRWCVWNTRSSVDAEDVAHDVLIRALGRLDRLTRPDGFRAWLWAITWRVLREHERRPWRKRWLLDGKDRDEGSPGDESGLEHQLAPDAGIEGRQRLGLVHDVLQALPLRERTLLWHAYVDGRTRRQIAEVTGLPEGTVNRQLTRARKRFRKEAERRGLQPGATPKRVNA
ncbi:MAG: sigma-70 family RNA polymerase sigma factor [Myxococcales bacterium]|nr:sigma-70 family RNA polymerase sigma factor [Myxococcales bacterium]